MIEIRSYVQSLNKSYATIRMLKEQLTKEIRLVEQDIRNALDSGDEAKLKQYISILKDTKDEIKQAAEYSKQQQKIKSNILGFIRSNNNGQLLDPLKNAQTKVEQQIESMNQALKDLQSI